MLKNENVWKEYIIEGSFREKVGEDISDIEIS